MSIKGHQIKNKSIDQTKLNIITDSIKDNSDITNKEYVDNLVNKSVKQIQYNILNRNMTALNASKGDKACEYAIIEFNLTNVRVVVNGADVNVGPGQDCYFSPDGGTTIRQLGKEQKGDFLYWNSNKYNLDPSDEIDFIYLVGYKRLIESNNSQIYLNDVYNTIVVYYTGEINTTTTVNIENESFIVGNVNDKFVWDINGSNEHTFTYINEKWIQVVNGIDYTIWYDMPGSLYFSIAEGNFKTHSPLRVKSFGRNTEGELGNGLNGSTDGTIFTLDFINVSNIFLGRFHSFLLFNNGTVVSFGSNYHGELGLENVTNYHGHPQTPAFNNVKKISGGQYFTIILFNDGTVKSVGVNDYGQLGMGNTSQYYPYIQTLPFTNVKDIFSGVQHAFLLFEDGTVKAFGYNNSGQLATGNRSDYAGAIVDLSFTNVKKISSTFYHTFILFNDGTVKSAGSNAYGQLGMGNITYYAGDIQTPSFTNVKDVSCGVDYTIILFNDGTVKSFGNNNEGQLGMGNTVDYGAAIVTPNFNNINSINKGSCFNIILEEININY